MVSLLKSGLRFMFNKIFISAAYLRNEIRISTVFGSNGGKHMFGLFSASRRDTPVPPIVDHPDFMEISRVPTSRSRPAEVETSFQRDYGAHRTVTEAAARFT